MRIIQKKLPDRKTYGETHAVVTANMSLCGISNNENMQVIEDTEVTCRDCKKKLKKYAKNFYQEEQLMENSIC